jgi:hypothetical protein
MGRRRSESENSADCDVRKRQGILLLLTKVSVVVVSGNKKMSKNFTCRIEPEEEERKGKL